MENFNWPFAGETGLSLSLNVNGQPSLALEGALVLEEGAGSISYKLGKLPLTWFDRNLPDALKTTIAKGEAEVNGEVTLREFTPATVSLNSAIHDFALRMDADT